MFLYFLLRCEEEIDHEEPIKVREVGIVSDEIIHPIESSWILWVPVKGSLLT